MYVYILLMICTLTVAENERRLWDLLEDIITTTHVTYVPEDARLNITQLAEKYKYNFEEHTVTTKDGYVINFHRIPQKEDANVYRPVVFLMHGILESSDSWLVMGPGKALAYVLADQGFDVWMGNARGNKHALTHATLNSTMPTFWEFSWEEIAMYDLPAMIDYILERTGQRNLYYIGHSQGTTSGYVMCSMRPEYNDKIKMMFSLAPEAWMDHVKCPLVRIFSPIYEMFGVLHSLSAYSTGLEFISKISSFVCSMLVERCDNILFLLSAYESKVNETLLPVILGHMPTGSSVFQFVHYGQLVQSKRFQRYDYGKDENMAKYGQNTPPDYDLSKITAPQVIFYSEKDWLSEPSDVDTLMRHLPNVYDYINLHDFTHIDYVYAFEAVNAIYDRIIKYIQNFEDKHDHHQLELSQISEIDVRLHNDLRMGRTFRG